MANKHSKITEEYKAEVTNILSTISRNLGDSVINSIEPKLIELTQNLENNLKNIEQVKNSQEKVIEEQIQFFTDNDIKSDLFAKKLDSIIKTNDNLIENANEEIKKVIFEELSIFTSNIIKSIKNQHESDKRDFVKHQNRVNGFLILLSVMMFFLLIFSILNFFKL